MLSQIQQRLDEAKRLRHQGHSEEAISLLKETLSLCRKAGALAGEAQALGNLGLAYKNLGRFEEAAVTFREAAELHRQLTRQIDLAADLTNLGSTLSGLGRVEESLPLYEEAKGIYSQHGDLEDKAICEVFLGNAHLRLGNLDAAENHYQVADRLYQQANDPINQGHLNANLGALAHRRGNLTAAAEYTRRALANYRSAGYVRGILTALNNLGGTLMDLGRFEEAVSHLEEALRLAETTGLADFAWRVAGNLAEWHRRQGDTVSALNAYERAVGLLEDLRSRLQARATRLDFVRQRLARYADLIYVAVHEANMPVLALEVVERARSRVLIEDLAFSYLGMPPKLSSDWLTEERHLVDQLQALRGSELTSDVMDSMRALHRQLEQHWLTVADKMPEYVALRRGEPFSCREIRLLLNR
jgi:tetratricopeptide (TPR) repeat protein